ncbi:heat shock protein [Biomphalaria pfeifferi]|uniref:Heat shock protein n=1 Tax=Biomphalaria pfeifferi TaxID=112525 RepID=A0AAD8F4W2_BIOPF|nr:heat shock protein [Biomphalaria pfeifferi]
MTKNMEHFTLFVLLPSKDISSLRNLPSGITVADVRDRLEMTAGLPGQIYKLTTNKGQLLHEDYEFIVGQNVWDGYIVRVQLQARWLLIYEAVVTRDVEWLLSDETLQLQRDGFTDSADNQAADIVEERGTVALYLACWLGCRNICQELLSIGVNPNGRTPFLRTAMFAAVAKDDVRILELLLTQGSSATLKDCHGHTALDVARRGFSRKCVNVMRSYQLRNGARFLPGERLSISLTDGGSPLTQYDNDINGPPLPRGRAETAFSASPKPEKKRINARTPNNFQRYYTNMPHNDDYANTRTSIVSPDSNTNFNKAVQSKLQPQLRVAVVDSSGRPETVISWDSSLLLDSELLSVKAACREGKRPLRSGLSPTAQIEREPATPSTSAVPWSRPNSDRPRSVDSDKSPNDGTTTTDGRSVQSVPNGNLKEDSQTDDRKHLHRSSKSRKTIKTPQSKTFKSIKQQIQLAEKQKRAASATSKQSLTFNQWLQKKRLQESDSSDENEEPQSETTKEENEKAFQDWLKNVDARPKSMRDNSSSGALSLQMSTNGKGFIQIVTSDAGSNVEPPDTSSYLRAYQEWKKERQSKRREATTSAMDTRKIKKVLEEKNKEYVARAITFDEWLHYSLDRQEMAHMLEQNKNQSLNDSNKSTLSTRNRKNLTFQQWRQKLEERENRQRAQRLRMRMEQSKIITENR